MKLKTLAVLAIASASLAARGQLADVPGSTDPGAMDAEIFRNLAASPIMLPEMKVNQLTVGRVVFGGLAISLIQSDQLWQLLNPLAPPRYGTIEDAISRDLITGKSQGVRILSIDF